MLALRSAVFNFTLFGIPYTPFFNTGAAVLWAIVSIVVVYFAWIKKESRHAIAAECRVLKWEFGSDRRSRSRAAANIAADSTGLLGTGRLRVDINGERFVGEIERHDDEDHKDGDEHKET